MKEELALRHLIVNISQGNKSAFSRLFELYYDKFVQVALLYVRCCRNAEDIVSEVFIKILKHSVTIRDVKYIEAYLYRMVKNHCLDFLDKKENRSVVMVDKFEEHHFAHIGDLRLEVESSELQGIIENCVQSFPPKRRAIYKLIKEDRLSYKQVAEILNIAPKTVDNQLYLAIKSFRKVLKAHYHKNDLRVSI